jgi:thioredoxin 1
MSETHAALNVDTASFESEVLKSEVPVLVDLWAAWCGPCRQIAPMIEEIAGEYEGRAKVVKIDMDANRELAQQLQVQAIPTLLYFKGGEEVDRIVGVKPKPELTDRLDSLVGG